MIKMINMYEWTKMNDAKKAYGCSNSCWKCSIQLWIGIWHCSISYNKNALSYPPSTTQQNDIIKTVLYQLTGRGILILSIYSRDIGNICSYHTSSSARWARRGVLIISMHGTVWCNRIKYYAKMYFMNATTNLNMNNNIYPLPMSFKIEMCSNW